MLFLMPPNAQVGKSLSTLFKVVYNLLTYGESICSITKKTFIS